MNPLSMFIASVTLLVAMTGCFPEDLGGEAHIVNDTQQPLFLATTRIEPNGGVLSLGLKDCARPGLSLYDEANDVFVTVAEQLCPNDTLTVRGPDSYELRMTSSPSSSPRG